MGACNNNPKTENTDSLVIKALAFSASRPNNETAEKVTDEIHAEKNIISPGCASCQTPCGNTSDYDMDRIYNAEDNVRRIKMQILSELRETALYVFQNKITLSKTEIDFFYRAVYYLSFDMENEIFLELLDEAGKVKSTVMGG